MTYEPKYIDWLNKAGADLKELPQPTINLIAQFNKTLDDWNVAIESEQKKYYKILVWTDAHLAACIYRQFKDKIENSKKAKLAALKARAAELKLNS